MGASIATRTESVHVREHLVEVLARDLVGAVADEVLSVAPSRFYLTGFLVPREGPVDAREDPEPEEGLASGGDSDGDDGAPPEVASARKALFPSSIGLSVLIPAGTKALTVRASWGEYRREEGSIHPAPEGAAGEGAPAARPQERWRQSPKEGEETISLPTVGRMAPCKLADGVEVIVNVRRAGRGGGEGGGGARRVRFPRERQGVQGRDSKGRAVPLPGETGTLHRGDSLVPRPNVRGQGGDDPDEQIAELQYRDVYEVAVGHGVSAKVDETGESLAGTWRRPGCPPPRWRRWSRGRPLG